MKATKVNAGLAESNGRLLLGTWRDSLHVTCGLTACTPGSAPGPTLGNEYGKTLPFLLLLLPILPPPPPPRVGFSQPGRRTSRRNRRHEQVDLWQQETEGEVCCLRLPYSNHLQLGVGDDVLVVGVEEPQHVATVVGSGVPRPQRRGAVQKRLNRSRCHLQGRLTWDQGTFCLIEAQIVP